MFGLEIRVVIILDDYFHVGQMIYLSIRTRASGINNFLYSSQ